MHTSQIGEVPAHVHSGIPVASTPRAPVLFPWRLVPYSGIHFRGPSFCHQLSSKAVGRFVFYKFKVKKGVQLLYLRVSAAASQGFPLDHKLSKLGLFWMFAPRGNGFSSRIRAKTSQTLWGALFSADLSPTSAHLRAPPPLLGPWEREAAGCCR